MEDAIDAFKMIFAGGQSWLLIWTLVNIVSHAFWNYAGNKCNMRIGGVIGTSRTSLQLFAAVSVTKELSATTKSVLDQVLYCTVLYCTVLYCVGAGAHRDSLGSVPPPVGRLPLQGAGHLQLGRGERQCVKLMDIILYFQLGPGFGHHDHWCLVLQ